MAQYSVLLSTGNLTFIDRSANPALTVPVGALSDIGVDFSFTNKELEVDQQFPIAVGRVGQKITLKAKCSDLNPAMVAKLLGGSLGAGTSKVAKETFTIPGTPYQCTVANAATWVDDLSVRDVTAGKYLTRVASAPATGQFSVAEGVYTVSAADTTHQVAIQYSYTVAGSGFSFIQSNVVDGAPPMLEGVVFNSYAQPDGTVSQLGYRFYALTVTKFSQSSKSNDFSSADVEFQAYPRASDGQVYSPWMA